MMNMMKRKMKISRDRIKSELIIILRKRLMMILMPLIGISPTMRSYKLKRESNSSRAKNNKEN